MPTPIFAEGAAPIKGRGTIKQPVFGINARNGAVYAELVTDCSAKELQAIIKSRLSPESNVHSDCWIGYGGLEDVEYCKHFHINKSKHLR